MINKINNPIIKMINPNAKKPIPIDSSLPWPDGVEIDLLLLTFSSLASFEPEKSKAEYFLCLNDRF